MNRIAPNIYIDISEDSIWSAIENNPWLFSLDNEDVTRAENHKDIWNSEFMNKTINKSFPAEIKDAFNRASLMIKE